jgi:hypothetical protein
MAGGRLSPEQARYAAAAPCERFAMRADIADGTGTGRRSGDPTAAGPTVGGTAAPDDL